MKASATQALNITGAGIGPAATAPNASSITRITWDGGSNGTTVSAGTTKTSDQISYTLDHTVDQIVTIYTTARNVEYYSNNNETLWSNFSGAGPSQSATVSGYSSGGNSVIGNISSIATTVYTYRNTLGSTPVAVWENDALLELRVRRAASKANAGFVVVRRDVSLFACIGRLERFDQRQDVYLRHRVEPFLHRVGQRQDLADFRFHRSGGNVQHRAARRWAGFT